MIQQLFCIYRRQKILSTADDDRVIIDSTEKHNLIIGPPPDIVLHQGSNAGTLELGDTVQSDKTAMEIKGPFNDISVYAEDLEVYNQNVDHVKDTLSNDAFDRSEWSLSTRSVDNVKDALSNDAFDRNEWSLSIRDIFKNPMLSIIEVVRWNFSSQVAGKLLVLKQNNEGSMEVIKLFQHTQGITFDDNEKPCVSVRECMAIESKLQINLSDDVSQFYEMDVNVPSPFTEIKIKKYLPLVSLEKSKSADAVINLIVALVTCKQGLHKQENVGYCNFMADRQREIWISLILKSRSNHSPVADVENDYFSQLKVNASNEGYFIDEDFMEKKVSEILTINLWKYPRLFQILDAINNTAIDVNSCKSIIISSNDERKFDVNEKHNLLNIDIKVLIIVNLLGDYGMLDTRSKV